MIARSRTPRALTAVAVVTAAALSAAVPAQSVSGTATAGKQRRHTIDMTWQPTRSVRKSGVQFDHFKVTGTPWSTARAATRTDLSQVGDDTRTPTFGLFAPARVKAPDIIQGDGRLGVEVDVLRTTRTSQTTAYRGEGVIRDSDRPSEYGGVITSLRGRVTCYASGRCVGSLRLKGYIDY